VDLNGTLDVSGNSQFSGTITVGVDDTGKDVKLFGATSGSYLEWDESADDLNLIASGIGVTTAKDLGTGIHIRTADSGASVNANCDELVIEGSGNSGLTILSGASSEGLIFFGDSGSNAIGRLEYNHSTNAMAMTTGGNTAMIIDGNGHVTMPLQSCFSVTHSVSQTNLTEEQQNTITFGNEIFDINGDFASNTFTAPVTGKYLLTAKLLMAQIDHDGTYYSNITINTSNRNYKNQYSVRDFFEAQPELWVFTCTCIADMDASDTAVVEFGTYGPGASQEDVYGTACRRHTIYGAINIIMKQLTLKGVKNG
jgi:hypothetical protein